ncbi:MAG: enoyl-CoA hydratase-related protein [Acidobacteria bacterium]|nr:enoyl-CoA hydratase-related protein [Acidobacteriota bacterium]
MGSNPPAPPLVAIDEPLPGVARITLDAPPVNALSRALVRAICEAAVAVAGRPGLRAVLVAARGKAFCAGADLKERRGLSDAEALEAVRGIGAAAQALADIPVPTIAVLQGAALGGGFELALGCDLRLAAEGAKLGLPECSLAIIPGAGGTQRLARLVGPARAKHWILAARVEPAEVALQAGLVDEVLPAERLEARALELAAAIARCAPLALRAAKRAIDEGLDAASLAAGLDVESRCYATIVPTEDRREALEAFVEKRPPRYRGC